MYVGLCASVCALTGEGGGDVSRGSGRGLRRAERLQADGVAGMAQRPPLAARRLT